MANLNHYNRRGVVISTDPETDAKTEIALKHCVHCGLYWHPQPGSGIRRGFCQRCMGDLCGRPACVAKGCVHWERQLELMEKGIPWELINESQVPVVVSVPVVLPKG